jgi:hypothetical protein
MTIDSSGSVSMGDLDIMVSLFWMLAERAL